MSSVLALLFNNVLGQITEPVTTPLAVSLREGARLTGLSTRTLRRLIANGALPSRKVGARRVVSYDALSRLVN